MSELADILGRRERLVAEAEAQRRSLSAGIAGCHNAFAVVDRGVAWVSWLRARPYLAVAGAAALALLRPQRALGWSARLLTLWRVGRYLYDMIKPARAHPGPGQAG